MNEIIPVGYQKKLLQRRQLNTHLKLDLCKDKIQSPEMAYILGLLWADGYIRVDDEKHIYVIRINLITEDIQAIRPLFDKVGQWADYFLHHGKTPKRFQRLAIYGKESAQFLVEHGYRYKESPHLILDKIDPTLRYLWWRGYSDGDGSFFLRKKSAAFSYASAYTEKWDVCSTLMDSIGVEHYIVRGRTKLGRHSYIRSTKIDSILKWGNFLYPQFPFDGIGLKRKYNIYLDIKNLPRADAYTNPYPYVYSRRREWFYRFRVGKGVCAGYGFASPEAARDACTDKRRRLGILPKPKERYSDYSL